MSHSRPNRQVTLIGDSTLDNTVWTYGHPTVIQHLENMLHADKTTDYTVHDYANDGFTTKDVLHGAMKDKVFPNNNRPRYKHIHFAPLVEGKEAIQQSSHVVISVGGNNIREFLPQLVHGTNIKERMPALIKQLQDEYLQIVKQVRALNPKATIILMTQYYPSTIQRDYVIYELMQNLYEHTHRAYSSDAPYLMIQKLMNNVYRNIFKSLQHDQNIIVADATGTLNPHIIDNFVKQIEPSNKGGLILAELLAHVITNSSELVGKAVRGFKAPAAGFIECPVVEWYAKDIETFAPSDRIVPVAAPVMPATKDECTNLLLDIAKLKKPYAAEHPIAKAVSVLDVEARKILSKLTNDASEELSQVKQSLQATLNVLRNPKDQAAIAELKRTAHDIAPGKPQVWQLFVGALLMLAGVAAAIVSGLFIPVTGGMSAAGFGGSLALTLPGGSLFANGIVGSGVSRQMRNLSIAVKSNPLPHKIN